MVIIWKCGLIKIWKCSLTGAHRGGGGLGRGGRRENMVIIWKCGSIQIWKCRLTGDHRGGCGLGRGGRRENMVIIWKCGSIKIWKCSLTGAHRGGGELGRGGRRENMVIIWKCGLIKIWKCSLTGAHRGGGGLGRGGRRENMVIIWKCGSIKIWKCCLTGDHRGGGGLGRWGRRENLVIIWKCGSIKIWKCSLTGDHRGGGGLGRGGWRDIMVICKFVTIASWKCSLSWVGGRLGRGGWRGVRANFWSIGKRCLATGEVLALNIKVRLDTISGYLWCAPSLLPVFMCCYPHSSLPLRALLFFVLPSCQLCYLFASLNVLDLFLVHDLRLVRLTQQPPHLWSYLFAAVVNCLFRLGFSGLRIFTQLLLPSESLLCWPVLPLFLLFQIFFRFSGFPQSIPFALTYWSLIWCFPVDPSDHIGRVLTKGPTDHNLIFPTWEGGSVALLWWMVIHCWNRDRFHGGVWSKWQEGHIQLYLTLILDLNNFGTTLVLRYDFPELPLCQLTYLHPCHIGRVQDISVPVAEVSLDFVHASLTQFQLTLLAFPVLQPSSEGDQAWVGGVALVGRKPSDPLDILLGEIFGSPLVLPILEFHLVDVFWFHVIGFDPIDDPLVGIVPFL